MTNVIGFDNLVYLDQDLVELVTPTIGDPTTSIGVDFGGENLPVSCPDMSDFHPICDSTHEDSPEEDHDLSDSILRYINQILMEEEFEEEDCVLQESSEFQVAEKSFYDAIGKKYPPSSPIHSFDCSSENPGFPSNGYSSDSHGFVDGGFGAVPVYQYSQSVSLFIKGAEEASKLIPNNDELIVNSHKSKEKCRNRNSIELEEEERSGKQAAVNTDPNVHSDMFDEILLDHAEDQNKAIVNLRETLKNESVKKTLQNLQSKGPGSRRRQNRKKVVVDLRTLLVNCAQAVTGGDHRRATELLTQIKENSSPFGDGNQRMAHCLARGLEARLAGNGSSLSWQRISSTGILKAYLVYLAACPFRKVSNLFTNRTISKLTRGASKIHIIDFGSLYGFQWPTFIQSQSERHGGSPKIRITGIDFPQPGFRPAQRVEETGRRLAHYAREFRVPFEFIPIAKRWDSIRIEDLKLEEGEMVIVNCVYRMKNLPDETMMADDSRNAIFNLIRKINPAVFVQGVVNGAYNAPFFLTRFREALFHFSSLFDMLETVMPRESEERLLLEREIIGREAFNVVGCEGWERVERPETYRQWQARTCRAGFLQLPLDQEIKDRASLRVSAYHNEFVIDQDGHWLLLGWKGRILYALSTWKPA